jgi:hypothetical protein
MSQYGQRGEGGGGEEMRNEVAKKMTEWWVTMCCNCEYLVGAKGKKASLTLCGR